MIQEERGFEKCQCLGRQLQAVCSAAGPESDV